MDGRSQFEVLTDERIQVNSAQSSLVVTHSSTNRCPYFRERVTELTLVATASLERRRLRFCNSG